MQIAKDNVKGIHNMYNFQALYHIFFLFKFGDKLDILCAIEIKGNVVEIIERYDIGETYMIEVSGTHVGNYCELTDLLDNIKYQLSEW